MPIEMKCFKKKKKKYKKEKLNKEYKNINIFSILKKFKFFVEINKYFI